LKAVEGFTTGEAAEILGNPVPSVTLAVKGAQRAAPDLVLVDTQLADGSSGFDAARDILAMFEVPVIFITAHSERLLTGERPEPTFLVTRPFAPEAVIVTIGHAQLAQNPAFARTD